MKKILFMVLAITFVGAQSNAWEISGEVNDIAIGANNTDGKYYEKCGKYIRRINGFVEQIAATDDNYLVDQLVGAIKETKKKLKICKKKQDKWYKQVGRAFAGSGGQVGVSHDF
jgi:hypothetical protein